MKLPSCFVACFAGCTRPPSETESSQFSVGKGPVSSGTVLGGILSSFVSRRSCSRGTWEYSGTDAQKPRVRGRGDADVVTLATARYLELFASTPKNDETSTILSEVREPQDSLRSARTASENQVSRSSTFTSREPSRLGTAGSQQQPPGAPGAVLQSLGSQRLPGSVHRRGASDASLSMSPGRDAQGVLPQPAPAQGRRSGSSTHVSALSPFTNKTRGPAMTASRCRSDRISPSTAAYLLPAPSIRAIARAHTAIPATAPGGSGGIPSSASMNDLNAAPMEGCGVDNDGHAAAAAATPTPSSGRPTEQASGSSSHVVQATGTGGVGRRSRLHTESGATQASTASGTGAGTGAVATSPGGAGAGGDLGAAAQQWVQSHNQLLRSSTVVRGTVGSSTRRPIPRRPSILFTRDGEVTVTGLPPSCLTAGRAPRFRVPVIDGSIQGSMMSTGAYCMSTADVSAPILCPTFFGGRGSMDSTSTRTGAQSTAVGGVGATGAAATGGDGGSGGKGGPQSLMTIPSAFLASRSNDPSGREGPAAGASDVCLSGSNLRHGRADEAQRCIGVSVSCGANAMFMSTEVNPRDGCLRSAHGCGIEGFAETEQEQRQQRQLQLGRPEQEQPQAGGLEQQQQGQGGNQGEREQLPQEQPERQQLQDELQQRQQPEWQKRHERDKSTEQSHALDEKQPQQQLPLDGRQQQQQPGELEESRRGVEKAPFRNEGGGSQMLVLANSSSEGQRCDWGGSSMFTPSRFSDSSRLTQANMTAGATHTHATASVHSANPLPDPCCGGVPAAAAAAVAAAAAFGSGTGKLVAQLPSTTSVGSPAAAQQADGCVDAASVGVPGQSSRDAGAAGATSRWPMASSGKPFGPSLLATEARDVTSALSRLQEACMAAVAQGDLRSMRLCRRVSTEVPMLGLYCGGTADTAALMRIGDGAAVGVSGRNLPSGGGGISVGVGAESFGEHESAGVGPSRITASLAGISQTRPPGVRIGTPAFGASASLPRNAGRSTQSLLLVPAGGRVTGSTGTAPSQGGSVTLAFGPTLNCFMEDPGAGVGTVPEVGEPWGRDGAFGGERASPEGGIVLDGAMMLERGSVADAEADARADGAEILPFTAGWGGGEPGPSTPMASKVDSVPATFEDGPDENHNRVLNVLLRSDFLHDTYDPGSEDEDDGVVEYRYGGFELGGGDHDCGFARQASFLEALRKCGAAKEGVAAESSPGGFRSAAVPQAAPRPGGPGAPLQRKGSCLAPAPVKPAMS